MKFRSPDSEPIHIALLTGHTAVVTSEGIELAPMFRKEAIARGALPVGIATDEPENPEQPSRADLIRNAMKSLVEKGDVEDFTKDGRPDLRALDKAVGFTVDKSERDFIWNALSASDEV